MRGWAKFILYFLELSFFMIITAIYYFVAHYYEPEKNINIYKLYSFNKETSVEIIIILVIIILPILLITWIVFISLKNVAHYPMKRVYSVNNYKDESWNYLLVYFIPIITTELARYQLYTLLILYFLINFIRGKYIFLLFFKLYGYNAYIIHYSVPNPNKDRNEIQKILLSKQSRDCIQDRPSFDFIRIDGTIMLDDSKKHKK